MAREHGKDKGPLAHPKGSGKWWEEETSQAIDNKKESDWLGDEGSNLDRQIQNLIPPRNTKSDQ